MTFYFFPIFECLVCWFNFILWHGKFNSHCHPGA